MKKALFNDDDSSGEEIEVKTNKDYAKSYNTFRQKELLKKLRDRERNNEDSESSSEESSSSEDEEINPEFDKEFYKTLALLKSKDPRIYDKNFKVFNAENIATNKPDDKKKEKAITIKDYERKVILERGGKYEDDEDEESDGENHAQRSASPSQVEQERQLKNEFKKIINDSDSENEEFGAIFKKREKTSDELAQEEEDYKKWLAGQDNVNEKDEHKTLKPLKEYWNTKKLTKEEQFLRDYVLSDGYRNVDEDKIPTYDEIVGNDQINLSDDEKDLEQQEQFEYKYNFRFEEPDQEFIKRYPRTIEQSVRKVDDRRKQKRAELKERKQLQKDQRKQDLEALKALKRQEIAEKIKKLKEVTGNDELPFEDADIEDDFDPDEYDKKMQKLFNDEYYGTNVDEEKPECPDIEDLRVEDWDNYDPNNENDGYYNDYEPHCEDEDFVMDCEYDPAAKKEEFQNELIESTRDRKKRRKKKSQFAEILEKEKPAFDPSSNKTYEEYLDEYYKLDYEDMIGDTPCRFKYVETVPNDFGLTIEEILLAKNKELNQWASLKKAVQIRPEHAEKNDIKFYKMKAQNEALKRKIFVSLYGPPSDEEDEQEDDNKNTKDTKTNKNKIKKKKIETTITSKDGENLSKQITEDSNATTIVDTTPSESQTPQLTVDVPVNTSEVLKSVEVPQLIKNPNKSNRIKQKMDPKSSKMKQNTIGQKKNNGLAKKSHTIMKPNVKATKFNKFATKTNIQFNGKVISTKSTDSNIGDSRLRSFGINPKKYHNKLKYGPNSNNNKIKQPNKQMKNKQKSK